MTQIFEWTAAGHRSDDRPRHHVGPRRTPRAASPAGSRCWPPATSSPDRSAEFPDSERDRLERQGIVSILAVPIFAAGEWWGFVGYDQCEEERDWQPAEIEALSLVANTLGAAIGRERAMRTLSETEARYQTLIEQIPAVTYMESAAEPGRKLYISPQVETILGFDPAEWSHERWQRAIHPDDRERVLGRGPPGAGDRRAVQLRIPDGASRRPGRLAPGRRRAAAGRHGRPAVLAGCPVRRHRRKEAEMHLREAEQRYRTLVEQIPAITYIDESRECERASAPGTRSTSARRSSTILGLHARGVERRRRALGGHHPPGRSGRRDRGRTASTTSAANRSPWSSG